MPMVTSSTHPRGLGRRFRVCDAAGLVAQPPQRVRFHRVGAPDPRRGAVSHQRIGHPFCGRRDRIHRQGRIRGTAFNITNKQYLETVSSHQAALDAADADVPNFNYGL